MTERELLELKITRPDEEVYKEANRRWDLVAKPIDGLGDFERAIAHIAAIKGNADFSISRKLHIIMCADNGVTAEGVSQTDKSVTLSVTKLMGEGCSSVGIMTAALCGQAAPEYRVYDVGIDTTEIIPGILTRRIRRGTGNITTEAAMTMNECLEAVSVGIDAVKQAVSDGYEIISTGEMGIGNTTTSTAMLAAITGISPEELTGRGAGLDDIRLRRKIAVIESALRLHNLSTTEEVTPGRALEILQKLGGLDIAALAGVFIGGAIYHIPVIVDGLISAVALLAASYIVPGTSEYALASHEGREKGVKRVLDILKLNPFIKGDMALGEGTGAVMLYPLLDMTMSLYTGGTSFEATSIEQYERYKG